MSIALPPDKEWLTAAEAAAEALPGFIFTEQHIRRFVSAGQIKARKRAGRGGGREFHWTSLPDAARAEYLKRHGVAAKEAIADPDARAAVRDAVAEARAVIIETAEAFMARRGFSTPLGLGTKRGLRTFCNAYNSEQRRGVKSPDWVFRAVPEIQPQQLRTWHRTIRTEGHLALRDRRGRPRGTGIFERDDELRGYCVAHITAEPHLTAADLQIRIAMPRQPSGEGRYGLGRHIALRTLQAALKPWRVVNAPLLKALNNPDKHRSHHLPAFGDRSEGLMGINRQWQLDATRADAMSLLPNGRKVRFAIMGLIDVGTRRAMVVVTDQPRGDATRALLRRAILAWGIPQEVKTDNGKEFSNLAVKDFCGRLGIKLTFSAPFQPDQKPQIERFFGTFNRQFIAHLPGFVGHNIEMRKAIESRASYAHRFGDEARITFQTEISPEGLQARADAWLRDTYEQRVHEKLGCPPAERALVLAPDVRRIDDPRLLDVLLMRAPDGGSIRTVQKKGISVDGRYYIAAELGPRTGYRVSVKVDPLDRGRIYVYSAEGDSFVCIAEDPEQTGADRAAIAIDARRQHSAHLRLVRGTARELNRRHPTGDIMDRLLTHAAGDGFALAPEAKDAMHRAAPLRLIAQREALAAEDAAARGPQPSEPTAAQLANADAIMVDLEARNAPPPRRMVQCDGYERPHFERDTDFWIWAQERKAEGLPIDAPDTALIAELALSSVFQLQLSGARAKNAPGGNQLEGA